MFQYNNKKSDHLKNGIRSAVESSKYSGKQKVYLVKFSNYYVAKYYNEVKPSDNILAAYREGKRVGFKKK